MSRQAELCTIFVERVAEIRDGSGVHGDLWFQGESTIGSSAEDGEGILAVRCWRQLIEGERLKPCWARFTDERIGDICPRIHDVLKNDESGK